MADVVVTKRVFDAVVAGVMLVLTAPLLAFTAWLVEPMWAGRSCSVKSGPDSTVGRS